VQAGQLVDGRELFVASPELLGLHQRGLELAGALCDHVLEAVHGPVAREHVAEDGAVHRDHLQMPFLEVLRPGVKDVHDPEHVAPREDGRADQRALGGSPLPRQRHETGVCRAVGADLGLARLGGEAHDPLTEAKGPG